MGGCFPCPDCYPSLQAYNLGWLEEQRQNPVVSIFFRLRHSVL